MKSYKIFNLLTIVFMINGCEPSAEEVAGKYYARHGIGIEYIEMRTDHTFTQYFKKDSIEKKAEGKWEFKQQAGQLKLILRNRIYFVDPFSSIDSANIGTTTNSSVYWNNNSIMIYPDFPKYNYYKKE